MNQKQTDQPEPEQTRAPALTNAEMSRVFRTAMPYGVVCIAVLGLLYTIYFAAELLLPIFFAAFLAAMLRPTVKTLKFAGVPEPLSALLIVLLLVAVIAGALTYLSGPVDDWMRRWPYMQRDIAIKLEAVWESVEKARETTEQLEQMTEGDQAGRAKPEIQVQQMTLFDRLFQSTWFTLVQVFITIALTFVFLAQRIHRRHRSLGSLPWREHHATLAMMAETARQSLTHFLQVSAIIYATLGLLTGLAMYLLGMPNPVLWGLLAAVFGFMPYLGPIIVISCIAAVSLLTFDHWGQIIAPPLIYGVMTTVEGYFVTPTILGQRLTLNPAAIVLSMLLWTWVWGVAGAFLAVPILVVATVFARQLAIAVHERTIEREEEAKSDIAPAARALGPGAT